MSVDRAMSLMAEYLNFCAVRNIALFDYKKKINKKLTSAQWRARRSFWNPVFPPRIPFDVWLKFRRETDGSEG